MKILLMVVLAASAVQTLAEAAVINVATSFTVPGTGSIGPVGSTPAPNNDNSVGASANVIPTSAFFNMPGFFEAELAVSNSGGTTEYRINASFVNNTGAAWTGFVFELGFGTGTGFTRLGSSTSLDFDLPTLDPAPASSVFPTLDAQSTVLTWTGATLNAIGSVAFSFAIDVPDNLAALHPGGLDRFTLRGTPIGAPAPVPEPGSMLLLAIGSLALVVALRGRRAMRG